MCKKAVSWILAVLMVFGCVSATAETAKQEKVYVTACADGTVTSVTDSIRLENPDGLDTLEDRTMLAGIENMGGKEIFSLDGEVLTWQAGGNDIVYQGTSDKAPALVPVVTITLDGETVSAAELKDREGEAVLKVSYRSEDAVPALAVTAMLLPEKGVSGLKAENAFVVNEMGRQVLVGYAVPGMNPLLQLPASFTASFHADHADLGWMMTIVTSEPIRMACEAADEKTDLDLNAELKELQAVVAAMGMNKPLPETNGVTKEFVTRLNDLNNGLAGLDDGAKQLADGAKQLYGSMASGEDGEAGEASGAVALSEGAAALDTCLAALAQNNEALDNGADAIFSAILDAANTQLAASGLDAAGITVPALTAENYAEILDSVMAQVSPDALKTTAYAQVETAVRPQVDAQEAQIRAGVEEAVKAKVLEAVLAQVNPDLTAEQYEAAVKAGMVTAEQAEQVSGAVNAQMETDEIKAQADAAVLEKKEELVRENVEKYLASDETVQAKLAEAGKAQESLAALKAQLDQVSMFVTGLKEYTAGVAQAADGASRLNAGAAQLKDGAELLAQGADSLYTDGTQVLKASILKAEAELAQKLLPATTLVLPEALREYEQTLDLMQNAHYDLAPEGIRTTTLYLIRTDL